MKISELISELIKHQLESGDIQVGLLDEDCTITGSVLKPEDITVQILSPSNFWPNKEMELKPILCLGFNVALNKVTDSNDSL